MHYNCNSRNLRTLNTGTNLQISSYISSYKRDSSSVSTMNTGFPIHFSHCTKNVYLDTFYLKPGINDFQYFCFFPAY